MSRLSAAKKKPGQESILGSWAEAMHCAGEEAYPTSYDGERGFKCRIRRCALDNALVRCTGDYGHGYPLWHINPRAAAELAWQFMKNHPKTRILPTV